MVAPCAALYCRLLSWAVPSADADRVYHLRYFVCGDRNPGADGIVYGGVCFGVHGGGATVDDAGVAGGGEGTAPVGGGVPVIGGAIPGEGGGVGG